LIKLDDIKIDERGNVHAALIISSSGVVIVLTIVILAMIFWFLKKSGSNITHEFSTIHSFHESTAINTNEVSDTTIIGDSLTAFANTNSITTNVPVIVDQVSPSITHHTTSSATVQQPPLVPSTTNSGLNGIYWNVEMGSRKKRGY